MASDQTHTPFWGWVEASSSAFSPFWGWVEASSSACPPFWGWVEASSSAFAKFWGWVEALPSAFPPFWGSADASTSARSSRERFDRPECSVWFPLGGLRSHLLLRWRLLYQALDHLAALSLEPLPGSERPASKDGPTSSHSTHRAPPCPNPTSGHRTQPTRGRGQDGTARALSRCRPPAGSRADTTSSGHTCCASATPVVREGVLGIKQKR